MSTGSRASYPDPIEVRWHPVETTGLVGMNSSGSQWTEQVSHATGFQWIPAGAEQNPPDSTGITMPSTGGCHQPMPTNADQLVASSVYITGCLWIKPAVTKLCIILLM
jgi:hypothetical protein